MNRDEKLTRAIGLPPKRRKINGHEILGPTEPGGGTWIAVSDEGVTLALINWYEIVAHVTRNQVSRGEVINTLSGLSLTEASIALAELPLKRINPFRLIGIYPATKEVVEWQWDLKKLGQKKFTWETRQWVSSGFDEPGAQRAREKVFAKALRQKSAGTREWLRRLHRSHAPERGAYSTCMHRAEAATVSYTEVAVAGGRVGMGYGAGAVCEGEFTIYDLRFTRGG